MPAGRSSSLTEALCFEICQRIADGETLRQIAADEHMPDRATIYRLIAADAQFRDQYTRAREAQLERWEDEIVEIADNGSEDYTTRKRGDAEFEAFDHEHIQRSRVRIDTRKWLMAKRMPKKYGDRVDHTVTQRYEEMPDADLDKRIAAAAVAAGVASEPTTH